LDLSYCNIERLGCYYLASSLANIPIDPKLVSILEQKSFSAVKGGNNNSRHPTIPRSGSDSNLSSSYHSTEPDSSSRSATITSRKHLNIVTSDSSTATSLSHQQILQQLSSEDQVFNHSLQRLQLAGNKITSSGAKDLANVLLRNPSITYLDISRQLKSKKIGPDGAREIASALRVDNLTRSQCQLTTLKCARNNIGFEGCRHIASALLSNTTLTELDVGDVNYITIAGAMQLAQAIMVNRTSRLAWLTVGEYRLPVSVLLGDSLVYHQSIQEEEKRRYELTLENQRRLRQRRSQVASKNVLKAGLDSLVSTIKHTTTAFVKVGENTSNPMHDTADGEESQETNESFKLKYKRPRTLYPISLHLTRLSSNNQKGKDGNAKALSTEHGMNDETGVVVATLLQRNRSLYYIRLDQTFLPVQRLTGYILTRQLDLSSKQLTSIDTIIIGILLAENDR
jgi:hypothetical protein